MTSKTQQSGSSSTKVILGASLLGIVLLGVVMLFFKGLANSSTTPAEAPDPQAINASLVEAQQWFDQQKPEQAQNVLLNAIASAPDDQDLHIMLGEALGMQGKLVDSYRAYERAVVIGPDSAELRFTAGTVANGSGLTRQALEHFWMAQQLDKASAGYPLFLAQIQRKLGELDEAKASLLRCINLNPDLHQAWGTLADIAFQENSLTLARQHVERARELDPLSVVYRLLEARISRRENKPELALQLLLAMGEDVILSEATLLEEVSLNYGLLQRPADAADLYATAAERSPDSAPILYEAALWYDRAGVPDAAKVYAQRAMRFGHEHAQALLDRLASGDAQ